MTRRAEVLAKTSEMSRDEWLIERRKGIGGSDASIILGLNKWKTPFELWLDKTGQVLLVNRKVKLLTLDHCLKTLLQKNLRFVVARRLDVKKQYLDIQNMISFWLM